MVTCMDYTHGRWGPGYLSGYQYGQVLTGQGGTSSQPDTTQPTVTAFCLPMEWGLSLQTGE